MENDNKNQNINKETERKLDKMRSDLSNSETCKIFAKKLTEYIKNNSDKKLLIFLFIILTFTQVAFADVMPYYVNSLRRYGIGYTNVSSPLVLRNKPSDDAEIVETVNFDFKTEETTCLINKAKCSTEDVFAAFSPKNKIALLTTLDESEHWSFVCFNQYDYPVCGWAKDDTNKFYNWTDFFNVYGKKYGLYLFKDLQKSDKILYAAPVKQTNTTGSIELPRIITPWLVSGNWLLVKVYDFNNQTKTGWINFRDNYGKLKLFVKF